QPAADYCGHGGDDRRLGRSGGDVHGRHGAGAVHQLPECGRATRAYRCPCQNRADHGQHSSGGGCVHRHHAGHRHAQGHGRGGG
nr:hypothetical protein [Tanacetum cinerariifolium]